MICALVLAAGRSERMGTQKLLLPLAGKPVVAHIVDELSHSRVERIVVVTGQDGERLQTALAGRKVQFVENPDPASDMFGSVRRGLRGLSPNCEAALVVLGDQPGITHHLVNELVTCWQSNKGKIVLPICHGHHGHPVLISSQYFEELLSDSCTDLRAFRNAHPNEVYHVSVSSILEDMDTPADYHRQEKLFSNGYAETVSPP